LRLLVNNTEDKITECLKLWQMLVEDCSKFAFEFLSFAHLLKMFFHHSMLFLVFSFSLLSFKLILWYTFLVNHLEKRPHCYIKTTSRLNKLLLGNLRNNYCEQVILPSSQSKITKTMLSSLTNQHSVILPTMLWKYYNSY